MERTLKLVGKTSNEVFVLRYPTTLLDFCESDFNYFAEHSIELCSEGLKTGKLDLDRMAELRREIQGAHCYIEHNIRTVYEKVVLDCWIDYVCRRDNIGINVLWNRYIRCRSDFEKAVFARLCDFRYNRAINEWRNIVRVQDYARSKVDFIFVPTLKNVEDAVARRNYFDLAFSVTAREMGCRIEDLGVTKTFSVGRVPTAPFLFPNISKEIVRNLLSDFDYNEDYSNIGEYNGLSDKIAMDAFSKLKAGLPQDLRSYSIPRGKMDDYSEKLYMPCSLKAAVDLEIDAMLENGEWLGRCKRCGRYFLMDNNNTSGYCSRYSRTGGKTCLEIYEEEHPKPDITPQLEKKIRDVTNEVYSRVDKTMSVKEYEYWRNYLEAMRQKVKNGELSVEELNDFLDYSLDVDITKSTPIVEVPRRETEAPRPGRERVVKPFVPERISREQLPKQEYDPEEQRVLKEGFFTSPTVQRSKSEKPQISHIIRNGESLGGEETRHREADPAGFQPFGAPQPAPAPEPQPRRQQEQAYSAPVFDAPFEMPSNKAPETERPRNPYADLKRLEEQLEEEKRLRREREEKSAERFHRDFEDTEPSTFIEAYPEKIMRAQSETPFEPQYEPPFPLYDDIPEGRKAPRQRQRADEPELPAQSADTSRKTKTEPPDEPVQTEKTSKPRVIRKNAAAISAYGKASGTPVLTVAEEEAATEREKPRRSARPRPAPPEAPEEHENSDMIGLFADSDTDDPFGDIGSIFDVLEQSQSDGEIIRGSRDIPKRVTKENAPAGIWTESRGLFDDSDEPYDETIFDEPDDISLTAEPEPSELDVLRSKKHAKSNKTRRLYDVIMREPDDNPNFRKKNPKN